MRRLIWGFAGRTYHIAGNPMSRLISGWGSGQFIRLSSIVWIGNGSTKDKPGFYRTRIELQKIAQFLLLPLNMAASCIIVWDDGVAVCVIRPEFFISWFTGFFFSDLGLRGRKKINKKALKMTSWLVIFRVFFFQSFLKKFPELFIPVFSLISPEKQ